MATTPHVLVVDDNVELAENLCEVLELSGASVVSAQNGATALELLGKTSFDLVLTDMRMPEVSGLELVRAMKSRSPEVPVVVMTAYARDEKLAEALARGALEILPKPVDLVYLSRLVERLGRGGFAVLVVEDDGPSRTNLTEALLALDGVLPYPTARADTAMRVVDSVPMDVAIVDLRLPDESGLELAEHLRARGLRVLVASGYLSEHGDAVGEGFAPGDVFEKPFEMTTLLRRVRELAS